MLDQYVIVKAIQKITSQPSKSFSVREFASSAGISPGAAGSALDYMKKKGITTLKIIGRTYQYRANLESPLCRQWKILFNLDMIEESKIAENLSTHVNNIYSILLYGSFAHGTNDERSDIDILVITHKPAKPDPKFIKNLGREANLTIMPLSDWKRKAAVDKVFYENVIYDSIVLYGKRPVVL